MTRIFVHLVLMLFCFLIIGEVAFRLPNSPGLLRYQFDDELGWRLAPNQKGCLFLGGLSFLSPPITINNNGSRNLASDTSNITILAIGSSEALGLGVSDEDVWTAELSKIIKDKSTKTISVTNASGPGFGPYQHAILLKRFLKIRKPILAIVRVSVGDRNFFKPTETEFKDLKAKENFKEVAQKLSRFLPFLLNKIQAQVLAIKAIFAKESKDVYAENSEGEFPATQMWERNFKYWKSMSEACEQNSIPLIFLIDDPLDTKGGKKIFENFKANFSANSKTKILKIDGSLFSLENAEESNRRKEYLSKYTLGKDPHANAAKHKVMAQFIWNWIHDTIELATQ